MLKNDGIIIIAFLLAILIVWRTVKKLTQTSTNPEDTRFMALVILRDNGSWMYGLDIVYKIKRRWGKSTRGRIYVVLSRMEDAGEIESRLYSNQDDKQGPKRREYKIKDGGRRVLDEADLK